MAFTIRKLKPWVKRVANQPGALAETLEPLAQTGIGLEIVVAQLDERNLLEADVFVSTTSGGWGDQARTVRKAAGFTADPGGYLFLEGETYPGILQNIAAAVADADVNLKAFVAMALDHRFGALLVFESPEDSDLAMPQLKALSRS